MALVDQVKILSTTTGTGAITFGSAVSGYRGVEALIDGNVYSYSIQQDADWELGRGTYLATGKTFVRSPLFSSVGGGQINLQQNAAVSLVVLAEDLYDLAGVGTVDTRALAAEIARATGVEAYLSNRIVAASLGIVPYDTVAAMNADLSKPVGTFAIVDEDNTVYRYTTPGGWIEDTAFGQALAAFVQPLVDAAQLAAATAVEAADQVEQFAQNLTRDAYEFIGRPGDVPLLDGTPQGIGSIYWHDAVDNTGRLTAVDVFDSGPATVNLAIYRGPLNALNRVGLTTFTTEGGDTQRRITLAMAQDVLPGDILAVQSPDEGAFPVYQAQSGDIGYTYGPPELPDTMVLAAPTTNGQVQLRFVIEYREQVVTADRFITVEDAVQTLPALQAAVDDLSAPSIEFIGRPGEAALSDGDPASSSAVWWRNTVDHVGTFSEFDVFDRIAATIQVAVYRGDPSSLVRIALTTAATTGASAMRRVQMATPISVQVGDTIALQAPAGTFAIAPVQSGDAGYSYGGPALPPTVSLGPPSTGGQYQVRFRISHQEQVVTAERFLALENGGAADNGTLRLEGFRVREVATDRFELTAAFSGPKLQSVRLEHDGYPMEFDGGWRGMVVPSVWGPTTAVIAEGNSLTDTNDTETGGGWATKYAQSLNVPVYSPARYSSDSKQIYRTGAVPVVLTLQNNRLLAGGQATVITAINGLPPGPANPASLLFTGAGDGTTINNTILGYFAGRTVTISVSTGGGSDYKVTAANDSMAVDVPPSTLFKPDFALRMGVADLVGMPGINYFFDPNAPDLLNVQAKNDTIAIYRLQRGQRTMVLGSPADATWVPGTQSYTAIRTWNAWLKATFPLYYAVDGQGRDTLARLLASGDGSAGDNADVANGVTPRSLRKPGDSLHLNTAGQQVVANLAIEYRALQPAPPAVTRDTVFTLTGRTADASVTDVARSN